MDHRGQGEVAIAAEEDETCPLALLPDDVLAEVLRRLPPRGLAASRCVCKSWLAVVDSRRLLRADLLPLSLAGFFMNFHCYHFPEFFAPRPLSDGDGKRDYLPETRSRRWACGVDDQCNGLVLVRGIVLNPATRWQCSLPPCPPPPLEIKHTLQTEHLAYDPTESPYFDVVSITRFQSVPKPGGFFYDSSRDAVDPEIEQSEWPPSVCILNVFSSRTGRWEERSFAREGDHIWTTVSDMRQDWIWFDDQRNAVYWRGALYVHCQTGCVMRISLLSDKYHVIKPPMAQGIEAEHNLFYLGKSSKGVYCASIKGRCRVRVWNLHESGDQMEWVLMHDRDLSKWLLKHKLEHPKPWSDGQKIQGPWALQDINYHFYYRNRDFYKKAPATEKMEWTSQPCEDEIFSWSSDDECGSYYGEMEILGFHPYKEIIFLSESIKRGLAYHLNSSKVEVLGNIFPAGYEYELPNEQILKSSFAYTPCWINCCRRFQ